MKKEVVVITGANGLVAKKLISVLSQKYEIRLLTRTPKSENEFQWDVEDQKIDEKSLENVDHIVHLAGANIFEKRWSKKRKQEIISSRVDSAKLLLKTLRKNQHPLKTFVSASAVGYYGAVTTDHIFDEKDEPGHDFLAEVVKKWENAALQFEESVASKVVILRAGVIISEHGGALEKMVNPIKKGIGSPLGSGRQYMPWISINDFCNLIKMSLEHSEISGVYNAVAPQHITNKELTLAIAKKLNKKIWLPNVPAVALQLVFGEASSMIVEGLRVSSEKLIRTGFTFEHPNIDKVLQDFLH